MTKTEQLRTGLLAIGAKRQETKGTRYECYSIELATTSRDPITGAPRDLMRTWYVFLGKGAGLRIAKRPVSTGSMPVTAGFYAKVLSRGTSV